MERDQEPTFEPPEKVAADEEIVDMSSFDTKTTPPERKQGGKPSLTSRFKKWWQHRATWQKILIIFGLLVFVIGTTAGVYLTVFKKEANKTVVVEQKETVKEEPPKPTTEASTLTGVQVPIGTNQTPVTGIMIENSPDARPQSGLNSAGVVFEAIAEGGITRFLALYQDSQPDYVGPVRSVRPYYIRWGRGFDAAIAHVGGSAEALQMIRSAGYKDLDQFFNTAPYWRISQRYAPHNMYTSVPKLIELSKSKGFTSSTYTGFPRKTDKPAPTPTAKSIDFTISSPLYYAHYDYDATTNSYKRSEGGKPHIDEKSGAQLNPKVVVALVLQQGIASDGIHTTYNAIGNGKAYIFQDGTVTEGTWSKESETAQIRFGDANGAPIAFNAGQTWITAVGNPTFVKYVP